jgi:hypothetical protein
MAASAMCNWLNAISQGRTTMRAPMIAMVLLMSSALVPAVAQDREHSPAPDQSETTPVQPERSPQQSDQSRPQDRKSAEDVRVGRDWRAQQHDGDRMGQMDQNHMGRMSNQDEGDHRTVGRNWQMQRSDRNRYDEERPRYYDEDRPRTRVKICTEYENGDEVCRYRN